MAAAPIGFRSPENLAGSQARLRAAAGSPFVLRPAEDEVVALRLGALFVLWRRPAGVLGSLLPHPALWCRLRANGDTTEVASRVAVPPDPFLLAQMALFAAVVVPLFGWPGLVASLGVSGALALTAHFVAAQFVDEDVPALERWVARVLHGAREPGSGS